MGTIASAPPTAVPAGSRRARALVARAYRDVNVGVARRARFRLHLRRTLRLVRRLEADGRSDANVLAIIAVETFFRPRALRLLEYAGWLLVSLLGWSWLSGLSVGRAQVQLVHWRRLGLLDSDGFSLSRLATVIDPKANYDACCLYLRAAGLLDERDVTVLTSAYTGAHCPHFAPMLSEARRTIEASGT